MWGESVSKENFDASVWEGAAALAERLWSNPSNVSSTNAMARYQVEPLSISLLIYQSINLSFSLLLVLLLLLFCLMKR